MHCLSILFLIFLVTNKVCGQDASLETVVNALSAKISNMKDEVNDAKEQLMRMDAVLIKTDDIISSLIRKLDMDEQDNLMENGTGLNTTEAVNNTIEGLNNKTVDVQHILNSLSEESPVANDVSRNWTRVEMLEEQVTNLNRHLWEANKFCNDTLSEVSAKLNEIEEKQTQMQVFINENAQYWNTERTIREEGCQSGEVGAESFYHPPFPKSFNINFDPPFLHKPSFVYALSHIDTAHWRNLRVHTSMNSLTKEGVRITVFKWSDTLLYGVTVRWMACPQFVKRQLVDGN